MERTRDAITFIVRVAADGPGRLRGVVERVRTGRKEPVQTLEEIANVIAAALREEANEPAEPPAAPR